jgi:hypothetical protein
MRLGTKGKTALSYGKKALVVAGALGAIAGIGTKTKHSAEEAKGRAEEKVDAGKVVAGGVADIAKAGVADVAANPLQAKRTIETTKKKAVGVGLAAKADLTGTAAQVTFAAQPKTTGEVKIAGATAYARPDPAGKIRAGMSGGGGGGGDVRDCDTKYSGKRNANQRRKCKNRVRGGGMP